MFIILVYAPILLLLPVLLLAGVVFVVVPGGFIVVLGGLYYVAVALTGWLGLAVRGRSRDRSSRGRRGYTSVENASRSGRSSLGPRGGIAPTPVAVALTNTRAVGSAPSLVPRRRGSDGVDPVRPFARGSAPDRQAGARPFESDSIALPQPQGRTLPSAPARKDSFAHPLSFESESRA